MIGKTISHYKILERLGQGGMGDVYLAIDTRLDRKVALKFLAPSLARDREALQRFENEARAAADLSHPNIAGIHHLEEDDGQWFHVHEYVEGETLAERLKRGPLSNDEAWHMAKSLAAGLAHAHGKGVVHRDLKPANIMITPEGQFKILDFGLAKRTGSSEVTMPGVAVGTVAYMSPDQARGDEVDGRTDIWSLGVLLYESTTGQVPFSGEPLPAVINQILTVDPPAVSTMRDDLPSELETVIARCLQKDAKDRYQRANNLLTDLGVPTSGSAFASAMNQGAAVSGGGTSAGSDGKASGGKGRWMMALGVGALAVLLAFLIPTLRGTETGDATETVTVEDEFGAVTQRVVPKASFRKLLTMYYADNESGDPELDWLGYGLIELMHVDLQQAPYMAVTTPYEFLEKLKSEGNTNGLNVPRAVQRKIASQRLTPWFVTSSFDRDGNEYVLTTVLHETESGKQLAERTFQSTDVFTLADQASAQLQRDLDIPEMLLEAHPDLPVSEVFTDSEDALRNFITATNLLEVHNDFEGAIEPLLAAIQSDPTFAYAHFAAFVVYLNLQQRDTAFEYADLAMEYAYRLPEPTQFSVKATYYLNVEQDPDKALAVGEMWTQLRPTDVNAKQLLAALLLLRDEKEAAIEQFEAILAIDASEFQTLQRIGNLYRDMGRYEEAEEYLQQFAEQYPTNPDSFTAIALLYETMGRLEDAEAQYQRAIMLDPKDVDSQLALARLARKRGNYGKALNQAEKALRSTKSPAQRKLALESRMNTYRTQGKIQKAFESLDLMLQEATQFASPIEVGMFRLAVADMYAHVGRAEEGLAEAESLRLKMEGPLRDLPSVGSFIIYLETDQPDSAEAHTKRVESLVEIYKLEQIRPALLSSYAIIAHLRGDDAAALPLAQRAMELDPTRSSIQLLNGLVLHGLGRTQEAEQVLSEALQRDPFEPRTNLEMARVLMALNRTDDARTHLDRTLDTWSDCDPEFVLIHEAIEVKDELDRMP